MFCYEFHYIYFKLLAANHLIVCERTKFDSKQKCWKFLLEIMSVAIS